MGCAATGGLACARAHSLCRAGDAPGTRCAGQLGQRVGVAWGGSQGGLSEVELIRAQSCRGAHGGVRWRNRVRCVRAGHRWIGEDGPDEWCQLAVEGGSSR
jgi:hypothetical protein